MHIFLVWFIISHYSDFSITSYLYIFEIFILFFGGFRRKFVRPSVRIFASPSVRVRLFYSLAVIVEKIFKIRTFIVYETTVNIKTNPLSVIIITDLYSS